jgi:uncharacterized membrane protein YccC
VSWPDWRIFAAMLPDTLEGWCAVVATVLVVLISVIVSFGSAETIARRVVTCHCGHLRNAHTHYTRQDHCGKCGCPHFRPARHRHRPPHRVG